MTTFLVTIEVERAVASTKVEANEVARLVAKYLRNFTYKANVKSVRIQKEKK
jgi:hypothetical protein